MIKYIGSKRTLVPVLVEILSGFPELTSVLDLFAGTSRVGHAVKGTGRRTVANDHNAYAHCLARCYVEADREAVQADALSLIEEFNQLPGDAGYFAETFCERSRFFQPHNGARVDAIREAIAAKSLPPVLESVVLTSLMEAADRVDSTCGLQMAYVKKWAPRSFKDLELRMPDVQPAVAAGPCKALRMDANEAAATDVDIAYIDPPYNQHSYLSNYHIWESLVLWDKPEVYGVACKRVDCRERKSDYNSKRRHSAAFADLVARVAAPLIVVSFNNEGYQGRSELETVLSQRGEVFVVTRDFKRYVGAQIGVYNPAGAKVGAVSHLRNEEYIYLVATPELCERLPDASARLGQLAARVGDKADAPTDDRVAVVLAAITTLELASRSALQAHTGLSEYQTRMALESTVARGLVEIVGRGQSKMFRLSERA